LGNKLVKFLSCVTYTAGDMTTSVILYWCKMIYPFCWRYVM